MENVIIDENHLATFTSPAEANIHRISNIAKLKIGLLPHFWDYLDWVKGEIQKNEAIKRKTGVNQIANFLDVYHYDFESWLGHTKIIQGSVRTEHSIKPVSYSQEYGYMEFDLLKSMGGDSFLPINEVPDFIKQLGTP